jgi:hypothetical protein
MPSRGADAEASAPSRSRRAAKKRHDRLSAHCRHERDVADTTAPRRVRVPFRTSLHLTDTTLVTARSHDLSRPQTPRMWRISSDSSNDSNAPRIHGCSDRSSTDSRFCVHLSSRAQPLDRNRKERSRGRLGHALGVAKRSAVRRLEDRFERSTSSTVYIAVEHTPRAHQRHHGNVHAVSQVSSDETGHVPSHQRGDSYMRQRNSNSTRLVCE